MGVFTYIVSYFQITQPLHSHAMKHGDSFGSTTFTCFKPKILKFQNSYSYVLLMFIDETFTCFKSNLYSSMSTVIFELTVPRAVNLLHGTVLRTASALTGYHTSCR